MAVDRPGLDGDPERRRAAAVDGVIPGTIAAPRSADEVVSLIRDARERRLAVAPRGSGTWTGAGNPPRTVDVVLWTTGLDRVVEYQPDDYAVTVQAGLRLADLQRVLAERNQWVPLDPPGGDAATVGGVLATRRSGPRRLLYGTPRDLTVGVDAVLGTGDPYRAGGRVMKNVAGYDVVKLLIGSLGTLGVITQATLRTFARPEARRTLCASAASLRDAFDLAASALGARVFPAAVEVVRGVAGFPGPTVLVLLEGFREVVERQALELRSRWPPITTLDGAAHDAAWAEWARARASGPARLAVAVPPGRAADAAEVAAGVGGAVLAHAGSGVIVAVLESADGLAAVVSDLRARIALLGGRVVVETAPPEAKHGLDVWGEVPGLEFMRRIKRTLDPDAILNPGRYVAGL